MNTKKIYTRMFRAALFVIVKHWNQCKYPFRQWNGKLFIQTMGFSTAKDMNKAQLYATIDMHLRNIIQKKSSQYRAK